MSKKAKKVKKQEESKFIYVPFIALAVVIVLVLTVSSFHSQQSGTTVQASTPYFTFAKVSNSSFSQGNRVEVYLVSWVGCPYGASDSWGLYLALSHFGDLNVTPNLSDVELVETPNNTTAPVAVPGLIFNGFRPNSTVDFHAIYLLGRLYNNGTASLPNGTLIPTSEVLQVELNELRTEAPQWVYNLVYQYQVESGMVYETPVPHIASTVIITGPNGTWMLVGYDGSVNHYMPYYIGTSGYNATQILTFIKEGKIPPSLSMIGEEADNILQIISEAGG